MLVTTTVALGFLLLLVHVSFNLVNISIQNTLNLYALISQAVHILACLIISKIAIQISTFVINKNIIAPSPIIKEILQQVLSILCNKS